MKISDEDLRKIVNEVSGEDPFWSIPAFEAVKKIIDMPYGVITSIGELTKGTNYPIEDKDVTIQTEVYGIVRKVCEKIGIKLMAVKDDDRFTGLPKNYKFQKIELIANVEDNGDKNNEDDIKLSLSKASLEQIVNEVAGPDPFWNIPVYNLVEKIIKFPKDYVFYISDIVDKQYDTIDTGLKIKQDIYNSTLDVCKKINIKLEELPKDERLFDDPFTWIITKRNDNAKLLGINDVSKEVDNSSTENTNQETIIGVQEPEVEQADFFKDGKQSSEDIELEKLKEDIDYEKRKIDEYIETQKNEAEENQRKLESIKKLFFEGNANFFDEIKMYLNETLDYDILNNPYGNSLRFEIFDKRNKKKMFFAINKNLFVLNDLSEHKLSLRGNSSNDIFSSLISSLEDITKEWKLCYSNVGEYYWGITICNNNKCNLYVGNSSFPNNWSQFIEIMNHLINDLLNKTNDEVKRIYLNQTEE